MKYLSIFVRVALLALGQSLDCHSASEVSLMDMGKISQCITTTKHSKAKTVCIFLGIYCIIVRSMLHDSFDYHLIHRLVISHVVTELLTKVCLLHPASWLLSFQDVKWYMPWEIYTPKKEYSFNCTRSDWWLRRDINWFILPAHNKTFSS